MINHKLVCIIICLSSLVFIWNAEANQIQGMCFLDGETDHSDINITLQIDTEVPTVSWWSAGLMLIGVGLLLALFSRRTMAIAGIGLLICLASLGQAGNQDTTMTDINGSYRFTTVDEGVYRLTFSRTGFITQSLGHVVVDPPATTTVQDVTLLQIPPTSTPTETPTFTDTPTPTETPTSTPTPTVTNTPLTGEFRVNENNMGAQNDARIAQDPSGDFAIIWRGDPTVLSSIVQSQRFYSVGSAMFANKGIDTGVVSTIQDPSAAGDGQGRFIYSWRKNPGVNQNIYARRQHQNVTWDGISFIVNSAQDLYNASCNVSAADDGRFVVVWQKEETTGGNWNVYFRLYDTDALPVDHNMIVNLTTSGDQQNPTVAMYPDGNFIVVWEGNGPGDASGIFMRRYNATGSALTDEVAVNDYTTGNQQNPDIAINSSGAHVIVWDGEDGTDTQGIAYRRYNAAGVAQNAQALVNDTTTDVQSNPAVSINDTGKFIILWQGKQSGAYDVYFARYDATGGNIGALETTVNTYTTNNQVKPDVIYQPSSSGEGFVVVWDGEGSGAGNTQEIWCRRFDSSGNPL